MDDDDVDLLVPVSFSITRPRSEDKQAQGLRSFNFEKLKHRAVVVRANGFTYRGCFVGADESELYLRGQFRWWVLPLANVSSVERDGGDDDDDDDDDGGP